MSVVENGNKVSVHYRGTFNDGTVFDSSYDRGDAVTFEVGSGQMIAGFNNALLGMTAGQSKDVSLAPEEAYGPTQADALRVVSKSNFAKGADISPGANIQAEGPGGDMFNGKIASVEGDKVVVDFNHPMAGKTLNFHIQLVNIHG
ncbi:peptidylprolyl isomerase [bacterium]|jgi:peptidylprolyl isomerase|nr:peptidylprolyl isomerase [bacterium]